MNLTSQRSTHLKLVWLRFTGVSLYLPYIYRGVPWLSHIIAFLKIGAAGLQRCTFPVRTALLKKAPGLLQKSPPTPLPPFFFQRSPWKWRQRHPTSRHDVRLKSHVHQSNPRGKDNGPPSHAPGNGATVGRGWLLLTETLACWLQLTTHVPYICGIWQNSRGFFWNIRIFGQKIRWDLDLRFNLDLVLDPKSRFSFICSSTGGLSKVACFTVGKEILKPQNHVFLAETMPSRLKIWQKKTSKNLEISVICNSSMIHGSLQILSIPDGPQKKHGNPRKKIIFQNHHFLPGRFFSLKIW